MGSCTAIIPPLKRWLDKKYPDLCEWHDAEWKKRVWHDKVVADHEMCVIFARHGHHALAYCAGVFFFLATPVWFYRKIRERKKWL
jgi:hypothetical protein